MPHVDALSPQAMQAGTPKPLPGLRQAAGYWPTPNLFVHPHCPVVEYVWFACTETQYRPGPSGIPGLSGITKSP